MSNFEKIILSVTGLLIAVVLVFGIIVFRLQKDVTALKAGSATEISGKAAGQNLKNIDTDPMPGIMKQFSGKIAGISENKLTVDIKLPDLSSTQKKEKFKNKDGSETEVSKMIDKKITVNTNEKTVFEKKVMADLKAGDSIFIFSYGSAYLVDTVTAEKVTYIESPK